ncbi:Tn7 transposase TnsA N-terminal domain-containing protein [Elizabethkingia anophelis]|uniref:TnsA endonuclease N-terminal domain-containing protein n=1 Tax=Elizabethkingia TaxID=308865 RepID=UPI0020138183|nr:MULTISPECIES: TnsA endonuclease N-terminal domain-containing protein [Elizabethkingia]MCL1673020.1 TnsA endonuclease N-terminal domain-containing protein [Elizabethkingia ursingii]MCT4231145.1 Tn7 transposase TnsA N-terminal domain-containing protein [Elizabethkingia anophelis]MCT4241953.1 Tn7 transposase TnsA N-terminal domain-containing protein [Elizabethkingia anophelis]MCT4284828.1 Tn7 transposase TnsA N-terminal domain-containing protein [Elizabethkingia anophelis]MCT4295415.1 Tn7 tran
MLKFNKRVREISIKSSSLSGVVNINSVRQPIQFESSLERDFIFLLEFDRDIKQYLEQPLEIVYKDKSGKQRKYIPDFIITYYDRATEIVEIKYESTLNEMREELQMKFLAAKKYCEKKGFIFKVVTDKYIREEKIIELENCIFLSRYKDFFDNIDKQKSAFPPINNDLTSLYKSMRSLGKTSVRELVSKNTRDENKQAELIFLTWYMVANNYLYVNFTEKLTLNSLVWLS